MPFLFFFSYARANRNGYLDRFSHDLREKILIRKYFPSDQLGFFDGTDIKTGDPWKATLAAALRTSQVMMAICSPAYINSEYCGKEFQIFLERYTNYVNDYKPTTTPRLILPILWGDPKGSLREVISQFQYSDDQFPSIYAEAGLYHMMDLTKYEDDYKQFVTRLANKIVDNAEEYQLPDVPAIRPLDAVNSAFHSDAASQAEEGDRAWFAFVAGKPADFEPPRTSTERYKARGGKDWRPFDPESLDSVGIVAQTVSSRYQRYFSEMPVDTSLIDRIKALKHEPVFVLVDAWSVTLHDYQEIMRALDGNITDTCAVVIAWNSPDDETERYKEELKRNLLKTFKYRAGVGRFLHYWGDVDSPAGLQARLLEMMAYYTNRVLESNQTPTAKEIDNEQAKTSLEERGLGVERPPTVQSTPGDPH